LGKKNILFSDSIVDFSKLGLSREVIADQTFIKGKDASLNLALQIKQSELSFAGLHFPGLSPQGLETQQSRSRAYDKLQRLQTEIN